MQFIETPIFSKQIDSLLADADYRRFQITLAQPRSGRHHTRQRWSAEDSLVCTGKRKARWNPDHFYLIQHDEIYLLLAYQKNKQEDLTHDQLRILRNLVNEEIS